MKIETIHLSHVNGQRRQMVDQIDNYGLYDFWPNYKDYLDQTYVDSTATYFIDAVISYHRIKAR